MWARLLKSKTENEVAKKFSQIIDETKSFSHLVSDRGSEFRNKTFKTLMFENKINHYFPKSGPHAVFAERVIRTLMNIIYKYISSKNSKKFFDKFNEIIETYNNHFHRIISMTPNQADSGNFDEALYKNIKKYRDTVKKQAQVFFEGDKVRLKLTKSIFTKGYMQSASDSVFIVTKVNTKHKIPLYTIREEDKEKSIEGQYYSTELQKVI